MTEPAIKKKPFFSSTNDCLAFKFSGNKKSKTIESSEGVVVVDEEVFEEGVYFIDDNNVKQVVKKKKFISGYCIILTLFIILVVAAFFLTTMIPCIIGSAVQGAFKFDEVLSNLPRYPLQEAKFANRTFNIVLLGDSLINKPYRMYNLAGQIQVVTNSVCCRWSFLPRI